MQNALGRLGSMVFLSWFVGVGCSCAGAEYDDPVGMLTSYRAAVSARNYSEIVQCVEPEHAQTVKMVTVAHAEFAEKGSNLERLLRVTYGPAKAAEFRQGMYEPFNRMFDALLLWVGPDGQGGSGAFAVRSDSSGAVVVQGREIDIRVIRRGKQWFVSFTREKLSFQDMRSYQQLLSAVCEEFGDIAVGIRDGRITAGNIDTALSGVGLPPDE